MDDDGNDRAVKMAASRSIGISVATLNGLSPLCQRINFCLRHRYVRISERDTIVICEQIADQQQQQP